MDKSKWGSKRICPDCGTKFYDFAHQPIVCPQCGVEVVPPSAIKPRRGRAAAAKAAPAATAAVVEEAETTVGAPAKAKDEDDLGIEAVDDELDVITDDDEDDDALIEDTSDLGDDEDIGDVVVANTDDED